MPHFRWRGVTIDGTWRYGRSCAVSQEELVLRMVQRGIALTKISPQRIHYFSRSVSSIQQAQGFETIALLLESGMHLSEACIVAAETLEQPLLQECFIKISVSIDQGSGIIDRSDLSCIFGPFIAHLLVLGYKSGTFCATAKVCAHYARASQELKNKVQGALAVPLFTMVFVFGLLWILFAFLVPSLTTLFSQFNAELPLSTRIIFNISTMVQSQYFFVSLAFGIGLVVLGLFFAKLRGLGIRLLVSIPFVGSVCAQWQRMLFLQALYALLQGGMSLYDALQCIAEFSSSLPLRNCAMRLSYVVAGGVTLSDALAGEGSSFFSPLMIAMVQVGQESNKLISVLDSLAERELREFIARLNALTIILQPILIIILGFIVLAVIGAVYMPLINIAQVVQ